MKKEKLIKKYDKQVKIYENHRSNQKLAGWRNKLIKNAYGKVLEVGVGAGANFPYYNRNNIEITGVDFSSEMIKSAKRTASHFQVKAEFIQADINELVLEHNSFDCIVSTLSLCSYPDPIAALSKFNNWCHQDGIILLMEHGLSSNILLSFAQNVIDPLHTKISGCHCNRNINKIIEKSNLQVEYIESYWSDIIYLIWAKPSKESFDYNKA
ncbi:Ubiquinone/menaquinone biosynthesis C-methylase UbiE [Lentibacillus halodurans]|uniref:Ubiquinone/menaquinone biosynthesis C-methylase UbiE n=1 Tax=Lentibacillus halodurans TaxID=237679 RepID=A0A1I0YGE3_9BACI|nr:class I SAM-dependent methyltransferase [Lentibacillus halodurans]SFB11233.1 Ubiquinone/menaquinone biosynthesis C-methylase UbiE [Lentibacillus halodurans]